MKRKVLHLRYGTIKASSAHFYRECIHQRGDALPKIKDFISKVKMTNDGSLAQPWVNVSTNDGKPKNNYIVNGCKVVVK